MKWREPWLDTMRPRPRLELLTRQNLRNALILTVTLLLIPVAGVVLGSVSLEDAIQRSWIAPVGGLGLAAVFAVGYWLAPREISSGPGGIVCARLDHRVLVPWSEIRDFRFLKRADACVLELEVDYSAEPERLYLPLALDTTEIAAEIRSHRRDLERQRRTV